MSTTSNKVFWFKRFLFILLRFRLCLVAWVCIVQTL
nr:MAG TPA: hypothetical protein [Caudoviricetes sp.]